MSLKNKLGAGLAIAALVTVSIVATGASASALAPSTDNYVNAELFDPATLSTTLNNTNATIQTGEKTSFTEAGYRHIWNTVWAKWKAPATGVIEADTDGSDSGIDTSLAIYTSASSISKATRLAWNDDADHAGGSLWSRIPSLAVKKGSTYYFQIGSVSTESAPATGGLELSISPTFTRPANDELGNAITVKGSSFTLSQTNFGSTLEPFEQFPIYGSVWYKWTPTSTGDLNVHVTGSIEDALVLVWEQNGSGDTPTGGLEDIDSAYISSDASDPLEAGSTYYFSLDSSGVQQGLITAKVTETVTGPLITKISASSGKIAGGTKITITGSRLTDVNQVNFGAESTNGLNIVHVGSTKITVVTPGVVNAGKVYVQLDTSGGLQSVINTASHYTYK